MKFPQFCSSCLATAIAEPGSSCAKCGAPLLRLFDPDRSLTREYLLAKKECCDCDCKNCPYPPEQRPSYRPRLRQTA